MFQIINKQQPLFSFMKALKTKKYSKNLGNKLINILLLTRTRFCIIYYIKYVICWKLYTYSYIHINCFSLKPNYRTCYWFLLIDIFI